jgi:hypothetical protein
MSDRERDRQRPIEPIDLNLKKELAVTEITERVSVRGGDFYFGDKAGATCGQTYAGVPVARRGLSLKGITGSQLSPLWTETPRKERFRFGAH